MRKLSALFIGLLTLSGCIGPTAYHKLGFPAPAGGYTDSKIQEGMYRVSFRGNLFASEERVADLGLLRCAEITLQDGYRYFTIALSQPKIITSVDGADGNINTTNTYSITYQIQCFKERPVGSPIVVYDAEEVSRSMAKQYKAKIKTTSGRSGFNSADSSNSLKTVADYRSELQPMISQGNKDGAMVLLTKIIQENPSDSKAYGMRGGIYEDQGLHDKAITDFDAALKINPKEAMAYYARGAAYKAKGELDRAISDYTQAIALGLDPKTQSETIEGRGWAYLEKGKYDDAIADFTKVLDGNPSDKDSERLYYIRAKAYLSNMVVADSKRNADAANRNYDLGLKDIKQTLALNHDSVDAYRLRAGFYRMKKDYENCWADVRQAQSLGYRFDTDSDRSFLSGLKKESGRQE